MAASRLLAAAAACVILFSFAAEDRKSYWSGYIQAAILICQQIFANFGASNFPCKHPFKECFKIVFFLLWRRDPVLELQFQTLLRLLRFAPFVFCNSVSGVCFPFMSRNKLSNS